MAFALVCDRCERTDKVVQRVDDSSDLSRSKYPPGWDSAYIQNQREVVLCPNCVRDLKRWLEPIPKDAPV